MRDLRFTEPPTRHSLEEARRSLQEQQESSNRIASKIEDAEQELKRILKESQQMIWNLEKERAAVEDGIARTLAYLSPIRRLPHELLGVIFTFIFDDYPCCAWVLSAVCKLWRSQVLSMPRLWSKVSSLNSLYPVNPESSTHIVAFPRIAALCSPHMLTYNSLTDTPRDHTECFARHSATVVGTRGTYGSSRHRDILAHPGPTERRWFLFTASCPPPSALSWRWLGRHLVGLGTHTGSGG